MRFSSAGPAAPWLMSLSFALARRAWPLVGLALATGALAQAQAPAAALRAYASTSWGPPFLVSMPNEGRNRPSGLIPDWYAELARVLQRPIEVRYFPPNRLTVETGAHQPDLRCFGAAAWAPKDIPSLYVNTAAPFLRVDEVLVSQTPNVTRLQDLHGQRVGAVTAYVYPSLDDAFRDGRIQREDAPTEMAMLRKQLLGRSDHAIVRRLTLEHLQAQDPTWRVLRPSPWRVSVTELYCGVRRGGRLSLAQLEAAQRQLLQDGTLTRLLKRYGGSAPAGSP